jgi:hypothetical protein
VVFRFASAFFVELLGFSLLYFVLPAKRISFSAALAGGLFAAVGFESLQWINNTSSEKFFREASLLQLYGSVPLLIVILFVWFRLVALVLLSGMVFTASIDRVSKFSKLSQSNSSKNALFAPHLTKMVTKQPPTAMIATTVHVFELASIAYASGQKGVSKTTLMKKLSKSANEIQTSLNWLKENEFLFSFFPFSKSVSHYCPTQAGLEVFAHPEKFATSLLVSGAGHLSKSLQGSSSQDQDSKETKNSSFSKRVTELLSQKMNG